MRAAQFNMFSALQYAQRKRFWRPSRAACLPVRQAAKLEYALEKLSDKELYRKCQMYEAAARMWRQRFIGLLPEVNRRRLYEKKGFSSVFEFAFKLCGLSAEQVRLALNLERRFEDKPVLKQMLENEKASMNKLTRIVSIATPENEEELAEKIRVLPTKALNTLVRDEKYSRKRVDYGNGNGFNKPLFEAEGLYVQTVGPSSMEFQLDGDVTKELNELHSKGIDVNEFLRETLKQRREEIAQEKEQLSAEAKPTNSRYISAATKKLLKEEHGEKCSISTCPKLAETIHHTQRLSLSRNHDPRFLVPLCEDHHVIAHSIDVKYHEARSHALD